MFTLLLRFAAPLQSWGSSDKFETRRTEHFPTRSGIVGLLAAALGRSREDSLEDLNGLMISICVEKPGKILNDFHTAKPDDFHHKAKEKISYLTRRYYLQDAEFLIAVSSENLQFLEEIKSAILSPSFPLYLGRRSCVPQQPIYLSLAEGEPVETLLTWQYPKEWNMSRTKQSNSLLLILEQPADGLSRVIQDVPLSFSKLHRQYGYRTIHQVSRRNPFFQSETKSHYSTDHDAFSAVSKEES